MYYVVIVCPLCLVLCFVLLSSGRLLLSCSVYLLCMRIMFLEVFLQDLGNEMLHLKGLSWSNNFKSLLFIDFKSHKKSWHLQKMFGPTFGLSSRHSEGHFRHDIWGMRTGGTRLLTASAATLTFCRCQVQDSELGEHRGQTGECTRTHSADIYTNKGWTIQQIQTDSAMS